MMHNYDHVPRRSCQKARKQYAIDTFLQKGALWPLVLFIGSVILVGLVLRWIDGLVFVEEASSCFWELSLCALATAGMAVAARPKPKVPASPVKSRRAALPDLQAEVTFIAAACRDRDFEAAELHFRQLARSDVSGPAAHTILSACSEVDAARAGRWLQSLQVAPKSFQLVVDSLLKDSRLSEVEELVMKSLNSPVAVIGSGLVAVFQRCIEPSDPKIEELLRLLRAVSGRHWLFGLAALLRSERHASSVEQVEYWMQRALAANVALESHLFNSAIGACARLRQPDHADKWLKRMLVHVTPDPNSLGTVISAWKAAGSSRADSYLARVKAGEFSLDCNAFNQIIKSCLQAEDLAAGERWLEAAVGLGAATESLCISSLISNGLRFSQAAVAEKWLCFLVERGQLRESSNFNAVISCYARQGNTVATERLVRFMCEHRIEPDVVTLGAAVHSFARAGQPRKAEAMFEMILTRGQTRPDVIGFNALIDACVKAGEVHRAEDWLERMLQMGLEPSVVSYTTVLHAYAKEGNIKAAEKVVEMMETKKVEANVVTYTALINACVKAGDINRAERWFETMQAAGIEANAVTFSAMLNTCAKAGDFKRAERWLEKMCQGNVAPTEVCFNNVIDACSKAGQAKQAEYWLGRLAARAELRPTRQSFTSAAQGYAQQGAFTEVERIFSEMEERGVTMDEFCLTVQLSSYARARPRQRERVEETLRNHHGRGLKITQPPLRVAKSVLGSARFDALVFELGLKVPNLSLDKPVKTVKAPPGLSQL
mmetsp:Transcript_131319/g.311416  ORF Transcript_131319/g.311416 Transcript_131319/m.311416 type:complete len:773 (+) Transcript_131319:144-2462(+)